MAEAVIDKLEVIKIDKYQGNEVCPTLGINEGLNDPVLQKIPVGQSGKDIVIRLMLQCLLVTFRIRYVILHPDEVGYLTRLVTHWCNAEFIPEQAPVLAIITQYRFAFPLGLDSGPYYFKSPLGYVFVVQKTRIQPENILPRIACYALKRGVHIDDGIIRLMAARDQKTVDARLNGTIPQADGLVRTLDHRLIFGHQQIQEPCGRNYDKPANQRFNPCIFMRFDTPNKCKRHPALQRYPQTEDDHVNPGNSFHLPLFCRWRVLVQMPIHTFLPDQDHANYRRNLTINTPRAREAQGLGKKQIRNNLCPR